MKRQSSLVYVGNNPTISNPKLWCVFRDLSLGEKSLKSIHLGRGKESENKMEAERVESNADSNSGRKRGGMKAEEVNS